MNQYRFENQKQLIKISEQKKVIVIGAPFGWFRCNIPFSAASEYDVTLLEAAPYPGLALSSLALYSNLKLSLLLATCSEELATKPVEMI